MKKLIITENDKDYIKSLYGLLNEDVNNSPIEVKELGKWYGEAFGPLFEQGFCAVVFDVESGIKLRFKISGENTYFEKDYNFTSENSLNTGEVLDLNAKSSNVIMMLNATSENYWKGDYVLGVKPDVNFKLEITNINSENKTPFIVDLNLPKRSIFRYEVLTKGAKNVEYTYERLKLDKLPKDFKYPTNIRELVQFDPGYKPDKKYTDKEKRIVVIDSPIEIKNIDSTIQKTESLKVTNFNGKKFIFVNPQHLNNYLSFKIGYKFYTIPYNEIFENEINYFVFKEKTQP